MSRMRRFSSARRIVEATLGSLNPSTFVTGSVPPPNNPMLRIVNATWPWFT